MTIMSARLAQVSLKRIVDAEPQAKYGNDLLACADAGITRISQVVPRNNWPDVRAVSGFTA